MHMIYDDCVETVHISMEGCLRFGEPRSQEAFFSMYFFSKNEKPHLHFSYKYTLVGFT